MLLRVLQVSGAFFGTLRIGHGRQRSRIEMAHSVPSGQILAVEEGLEAGGRLIVFLSDRGPGDGQDE